MKVQCTFALLKDGERPVQSCAGHFHMAMLGEASGNMLTRWRREDPCLARHQLHPQQSDIERGLQRAYLVTLGAKKHSHP